MTIKNSIVKHILVSNYYLTKICYHAWLHIRSRNKQPLLIYQMGKVGSTAVQVSLQAADLEVPIYHVHVLTEEGIKWKKSHILETNQGYLENLYGPQLATSLQVSICTINFQEELKIENGKL